MPRRVRLIVIKQVKKLLNDLISKVFVESPSNSSETFSSSSPYSTIIILQEIEQVLYNEF